MRKQLLDLLGESQLIIQKANYLKELTRIEYEDSSGSDEPTCGSEGNIFPPYWKKLVLNTWASVISSNIVDIVFVCLSVRICMFMDNVYGKWTLWWFFCLFSVVRSVISFQKAVEELLLRSLFGADKVFCMSFSFYLWIINGSTSFITLTISFYITCNLENVLYIAYVFEC